MGKLVWKIIRYLFVFILMFISVVPLLWVVMSSFKTNGQIVQSAFSLPTQFNFNNFAMAFKIAPIAQFYLNSIFVAVLATAFNLIIMSMSAYVLARFDFKLKGLLTLLLSVTLFIPASALLQPLFATINGIGLYDSLFGLIVVYVGLGLPITLFIMISYVSTIPVSLEESAYIDGASFLQTFFKIVVPLMKPAFGTAAVLQFLLCWNEFQYAITLTVGNSSRTLPLALGYFTSMFSANYGALFAAITVSILPSILMYMLMQKQVVAGLTAGAVKG